VEPVAKARARAHGIANLGLDPQILSLSEKFGQLSGLVDEVQQRMEAQYGLMGSLDDAAAYVQQQLSMPGAGGSPAPGPALTGPAGPGGFQQQPPLQQQQPPLQQAPPWPQQQQGQQQGRPWPQQQQQQGRPWPQQQQQGQQQGRSWPKQQEPLRQQPWQQQSAPLPQQPAPLQGSHLGAVQQAQPQQQRGRDPALQAADGMPPPVPNTDRQQQQWQLRQAAGLQQQHDPSWQHCAAPPPVDSGPGTF
jgi:hypothetical protein